MGNLPIIISPSLKIIILSLGYKLDIHSEIDQKNILLVPKLKPTNDISKAFFYIMYTVVNSSACCIIQFEGFLKSPIKIYAMH